MPLTASIEVPGKPMGATAFEIVLRIANRADHAIAVLNPDLGIPSPGMNWPWSNAVYQVSLLMWFHYLSISVSEERGQELPQQAMPTWATPALSPAVELAPGESISLAIPIGTFYRLEPGKEYRMAIEYGDREAKVSAQALVVVR